MMVAELMRSLWFGLVRVHHKECLHHLDAQSLVAEGERRALRVEINHDVVEELLVF